tara:strand:+ start:295 stop:492 length:198 start_codon:yes stop_codon:yes gene_type:complete
MRRNAGACLFADPSQMKDTTQYLILAGEETNDSFANDCLDWRFASSGTSFDGTNVYSIKVDDPFF